MSFESGYSYFAKHKPSGEDWYLIGIDPDGDRVCAAGWPPTIGKLSDCDEIKKNEPLTPHEIRHRIRNFGTNWI